MLITPTEIVEHRIRPPPVFLWGHEKAFSGYKAGQPQTPTMGLTNKYQYIHIHKLQHMVRQ